MASRSDQPHTGTHSTMSHHKSSMRHTRIPDTAVSLCRRHDRLVAPLLHRISILPTPTASAVMASTEQLGDKDRLGSRMQAVLLSTCSHWLVLKLIGQGSAVYRPKKSTTPRCAFSVPPATINRQLQHTRRLSSTVLCRAPRKAAWPSGRCWNVAPT